jgi:hypothetical protein
MSMQKQGAPLPDPQNPQLRLSDADKARQRRRSKAIALGLVGLCVLFYAITLVKMGAAVFNRPM